MNFMKHSNFNIYKNIFLIMSVLGQYISLFLGENITRGDIL